MSSDGQLNWKKYKEEGGQLLTHPLLYENYYQL